MLEPTYRIAQRLHERRAAVGLPKYGRHLDADSRGCMLVHSLEEATDQVNYLLAEIQRRREAIVILALLADSLREVRDYGFADTVETAIEWIGGRAALAQYDEILGGGTVAEDATVDARDEAMRVAVEALRNCRAQFESHAGEDALVEVCDFALAAIRAAGGAR